MNISNKNYIFPAINDKHLFFIVFVAILIILYFYSIYKISFITTDSAQYISVAKNLISGEGLTTSLIYYEQHYQQNELPVPQTVFPPGYSMLLAVPAVLGSNLIEASFLVNLVSFILIPVLIYKILVISEFKKTIATISAVAWLLTSINWEFVLVSLSEIPFVLFILASVFFFIKYENNKSSVKYLILSAVLLGFSFWIRYAGLFLIVAILLYQVLQLLKSRNRHRVRDILVYGTITIIWVTILFARNYYYVGDIAGGVKINNPSSTVELLQSFYWAILKLAGMSGESQWEQIAIYFVVSMIISVLGFSAYTYIIKETDFTLKNKRMILFSVVNIFVYMSFIVYLAANNDRQYLNERYLMPILPFIIMLFVVLSGMTSSNSKNKSYIVLPSFVLVAILLLVLQTRNFSKEMHWIDGRKDYQVASLAMSARIDDRTVLDYFRETISINHPLLMPNGQLTGVFFDIPVVGLTQALFTNRIWTEPEVKELVKQYKIEHILFLKSIYRTENPANQNKILFNSLKNGKVPDWIEPVYDSDKFSIYKVI